MFTGESEPPVITFTCSESRSLLSSRAHLIDVSLMAVNSACILVDSLFEGNVAENMCADYDGSEDVFSDFLLTDVARSEPAPMDFFGTNTAEYLTRKRRKRHIMNMVGRTGGAGMQVFSCFRHR